MRAALKRCSGELHPVGVALEFGQQFGFHGRFVGHARHAWSRRSCRTRSLAGRFSCTFADREDLLEAFLARAAFFARLSRLGVPSFDRPARPSSALRHSDSSGEWERVYPDSRVASRSHELQISCYVREGAEDAVTWSSAQFASSSVITYGGMK